MQISGELALFPQVPRYVSGAIDLGYWYEALDYSVAHMFINGGNVRVMPGTAIAVRNEWAPWLDQWAPDGWSFIGFHLAQNSTFVSDALPAKPNIFTAARFVQEGPFDFGFNIAFISDFEGDHDVDTPPNLSFRFSDFSFPLEDFHLASGYGVPSWTGSDANSSLSWSMRDCNLRGGRIWMRWTDGDYATYPPGMVGWTNNSFDRVAILVIPTWYPDNGTINVDFAFDCYNNLFRGGQYMDLDPVPASAGRWLFKDNLFDKTAFFFYTPPGQPSWAGPIDHDYNAYWQRLTSELQPNQSARLTPNNSDGGVDAVNDRLLSSAPAYQPGPLGGFYLPTSSELYSTTPNPEMRGSRSAADASLYHHTTRVDQTKNGDQTGNVIIGRHYIATTSSSSASPKDSDVEGADGVPDYVENWHGDGRFDWHHDTETDWQHINSTLGTDGVTPVADKYSLLYDDIDLDGDGMVGRIEKALNTNPLLADNPLALKQEITGQEPDIVTFTNSINYDSLADMGSLSLRIDGESIANYEIVRKADGNCRIIWNTTFSTPGEHWPSVRLNVDGFPDQNAAQPQRFWAPGPLLHFPVNNILQFDPFFSTYYDEGWLHADLAVDQATYTIRLYDPSTPSAPPFNTITGTTTDGIIHERWDLTSPIYAGSSATAAFEVTPLGGAPETHATSLSKTQTPTKSPDGGFIVAFFKSEPGDDSYVARAHQTQAVDILLKPDNIDRYTSSLNAVSGSGANPGFVSSLGAVATLLGKLGGDTRNFYCFGDGSADSIGSYDASVKLSRKSVTTFLHNQIVSDPEAHAYRLVFLNACLTAEDPGWAGAFGVVGEQLTFSKVISNPGSVQAFLGWHGLCSIPSRAEDWENTGGQTDFGYGASLGVFFTGWMGQHTLSWCRRHAAMRDPYGDGSTLLRWPLGHKTGDPKKDDFSLRHYGYEHIKRTSYSASEQ